MPIHDAMVHGNHIITTKYGGITEYLTEKSANIIPHKLKPVSGMEWSPLYNSSQLWAYPDQLLLGNIMRNVYNNKSKYDLKRKNGNKIGKSFDIADCSKRIETILSKGRFAKNR